MVFKHKHHFSSFLLLISVFVIHSLLFIVTSSAQSITWEKTYNSPLFSQDYCYDACIADTGSFYLAGNTINPGSIFIVKIDTYGNVIWSSTFNVSNSIVQNAYCITSTTDGGCVVAGTTDSIYMLKINSNGAINWYRTYIVGFYSGLSGIQRTENGGFIACGEITTSTTGGYVVRVDSLGNLDWKRTYDTTGARGFTAIEQAFGEGYFISGYSRIPANDTSKLEITKIDTAGNVLWERTFNVFSEGFSPAKLAKSSNYYLISGTRRKPTVGTGHSQVSLLRIDMNGNLKNTFGFGTTNDERGFDVEFISSNRYMVSGEMDSSTTTNGRVFVVDSLGNVMLRKILKSPRYLGLNAINKLINGDLLFTGTYRLPNVQGTYVYYAARTDSVLNYSPIGLVPYSEKVPNSPSLSQNFPNPFNSQTVIQFDIPKDGLVSIALYNILGQSIKQLVSEKLRRGMYRVSFDFSDLTSGTYFYRMVFEDTFYKTQKMVLLK